MTLHESPWGLKAQSDTHRNIYKCNSQGIRGVSRPLLLEGCIVACMFFVAFSIFMKNTFVITHACEEPDPLLMLPLIGVTLDLYWCKQDLNQALQLKNEVLEKNVPAS